MALWRVSVGDVSHRLVEAGTADEARRIVTQAVVDALDVRAEVVPGSIQRMYAGLGPRQALNFLAATDGLTNPRSTRSARSARRRLAREVRFDMQVRTAAQERSLPPADPGRLDALLRSSELRRVQAAQSRLREFERDLYGEDGPGPRYSS